MVKSTALDLPVVPITRNFRFFNTQAGLSVVLLLTLSGCAPLQVRFGQKMYLDKVPVASMTASLPRGPGIAPGEKSPLVAVFTEPGGEVLKTEGEGHGKILWKDVKVDATLVTANQKGVLTLPQDPTISDGKVGHVVLTVPTHPDLRAELDVPIRYDYSLSANFSGSSGSSGFDGSSGTDGMSGSSGSMDPNNPSAGGSGSDGGNGGDGSRGGDGGNGPDVQVRVALKSESRSLLQVKVSASGNERLFLVDPQGGSLTVTSAGGSGGSGGRGGRGGRGGSGGIGTPSGSSGHDGRSGSDGSSGSSGRGGRITVTYDPKAQPYLSALRILSPSGPTPLFREETVEPLW